MRRIVILSLVLAACGGDKPEQPPITVFAAASLARPLASLSESFHAASETPLRAELGGSMELSRRMTELGQVPDVLLLADDDVMAALLPAHADWYVRFATSRLVVAYTTGSRGSDSISTENWWQMLSRDSVTVGRADSAIAPAGRHALGVLRTAERYYKTEGLTRRLLARSTQRLVRPNATELAALLEAGEVDYILEYESVARQFGFQYVRLPNDLAPAVLYGVAIPRASTRQADAEEFVRWLLGERAERIMRDASVDVLRVPVAVGRNVPESIADVVRTMALRPGSGP